MRGRNVFLVSAIRDAPVVVGSVGPLEKMAMVELKHPLLVYADRGRSPQQMGSLGDRSFTYRQDAVRAR